MKMYLDGVLVVEGKEDAAYLSNYIASEIVVLNGYEMADSTVRYLKNKKVIALLDPDEAGDTIRERLNNVLDNIHNVFIDIDMCNRGNKTGVAECQIEEIMRVLQPFCIDKPLNQPAITQSDLCRLNLMGSDNSLRLYVCKELNLGRCNGKQLYKRLSLNHTTLAQLEEVVRNYENGN